MNKYIKYKNLYLEYKQMIGGSNTIINDLIGRVNDKSVFHLLNTLDYGIATNSVAYIYWSDDFSPFTVSHGKFISAAIHALINSNKLIKRINVYLVPKFNSKTSNIQWYDQMNLIKLAVKELNKLSKGNDLNLNFFPSDFSQLINSSIYMYENFASKPDLYLELELFCKLNTINPKQIYCIIKHNELIRIFTGIDQTNTIHLISKYNFISWNKKVSEFDLEIVNKNTNPEFLQTLPVTTKLLKLLFDRNLANFKLKLTQYPDPDSSLIKYDDKRLDFFYENEVKLNGELDYKTMELSIRDINPKMNKIIIFLFEEDLDLISSMVRNGIKFINQNMYQSLINYIGSKGLYF